MKNQADPDSTRDALLGAARALFARHGYDGASVRALTTAAKANLGAVTYHFGTKRQLYEEVVGNAMEALALHILAALQVRGTPLDRLESAERAFFAHFAQSGETPRLMLQELAAGRTPPVTATSPMRRIHGTLTELIAEGQADGSIRAGPAHVMALSIVAQPAHLFLVRRPVEASTGIDLSDPATAAQVVENAVSFVRGGLARQTGELAP